MPSAAALGRETACRACRDRNGRRDRDRGRERRSGRWWRGRIAAWRQSYCWLLLSETMQCPEPPYEIDRMDPYDRPVIDQLGKHAECHAILRVVERRHQDGPVRDVKV